MKKSRILSLCAFAAAAVSFSGCGVAYDTTYHGPEVEIEPAHNFLGIVTVAPGSFETVSPCTINLRSTEVSATRTLSGDNIKLFWGAFTFTDY